MHEEPMAQQYPERDDPLTPAAPVPTQLARAAAVADRASAAHALERYRAGLAPATLRAHANDLALWSRYLGAVGITDPPDAATLATEVGAWRGVTAGLLAGFVEWLLREGYALASINRRLATVRAYLIQVGLSGGIPAADLTLLRGVRGLGGRAGRRRAADRPVTRRSPKQDAPRPIPYEAVLRLKQHDLTKPQGARDALLAALLLDLGLRVGELAALTREDVDMPTGVVRVVRRKVDLEQRLLLSPDCRVALQAYLGFRGDAPGALLWQTRRDGTLVAAPLGVRGIRKRISVLGARAGVPDLAPHDCRHAWTALAFAGGSDLAAVMSAGGWRSAAMPLHYAQVHRLANVGVRLALPPVLRAANSPAVSPDDSATGLPRPAAPPA